LLSGQSGTSSGEFSVWRQLGLAKVVGKYGILSDNDDGFLKVENKEMGTDINTMPLPSSHGHHFQEQVEAFDD